MPHLDQRGWLCLSWTIEAGYTSPGLVRLGIATTLPAWLTLTPVTTLLPTLGRGG